MGGRAGGGARGAGGGAMAGSRNGLIPQSTMEVLGLPKELNKKGVVFDKNKSNISENWVSFTYVPQVSKSVQTAWKGTGGKVEGWSYDDPKQAGKLISGFVKKGYKIKVDPDLIS